MDSLFDILSLYIMPVCNAFYFVFFIPFIILFSYKSMSQSWLISRLKGFFLKAQKEWSMLKYEIVLV